MEINEFFSDLKDNYAYLIPAVLFIAASLLHLAVDWDITSIVIIQVLFFVWAAVVAYRRELVLWPLVVPGLICIIISSGMSLKDEYDLKRITEAIASDDTIRAGELLDDIDSEKIIKSKEYLQLDNYVKRRNTQMGAELAVKARDELRKNDIAEAKKTLSLLLDYDSDNKSAPAISEAVKREEIALVEKGVTTETLKALKKLRIEVNRNISRKKYDDAKKLIELFTDENSEIDNDNIVITDLLETVEEKEKGAEIARQKQLNYKRISKALFLYRKKEYGDSVDLLEEVLEHDSRNRQAKKLLKKATAKLEKERADFWEDLVIAVLVIGGLIFYIRRNWWY